MKEVKLVRLNELTKVRERNRWYRDNAKPEQRLMVERGLANLLNEGWQIAVTGGASMYNAFIILVREH